MKHERTFPQICKSAKNRGERFFVSNLTFHAVTQCCQKFEDKSSVQFKMDFILPQGTFTQDCREKTTNQGEL